MDSWFSVKFLHLWFLLFDCFVCHQNVTCLKLFTRYGHYTGEVEDSHSQTYSCLLSRFGKNLERLSAD